MVDIAELGFKGGDDEPENNKGLDLITKSLRHNGLGRAIEASNYLRHNGLGRAIEASNYLRQFSHEFLFIKHAIKIEKTLFYDRLHELLDNVYPVLTIEEICILWVQSFELVGKRERIAKRLIELYLRGALVAKYLPESVPIGGEQYFPALPFTEQVKTGIHIDSFFDCALSVLGEDALAFAAYWRGKMKRIDTLPSNPIKGNPESMNSWVNKQMVQDGVNLGNLPRGYQQKLIKEAQEYGFDEQGTAVKRAFKALKTQTHQNAP